MGFFENNEMVQTFGSHRSHPSLRDGIGSGRPERRTNLPYSEPPHATTEVRAIAAVAIVNQENRGGARSQAQHSTICCAAQSAVGCRVTATWKISLFAEPGEAYARARHLCKQL